MEDDWTRLADYVVAGRRRRGFSTKVAFIAHLEEVGQSITERTLSKLESGGRVGASTLAAVEFGLGWKPGSARAVLRGGEPTLIDSPPSGDPATPSVPSRLVELAGDDPGHLYALANPFWSQREIEMAIRTVQEFREDLADAIADRQDVRKRA